ncbi:MAG: TlpA disulfide reductase family protein [Gemmatimonadota bacterium]|jgi:peroxiredoxin
MSETEDNAPVPRWRTALLWAERLVLAGLFAFAAYRFAPQLGALTGVGPDLGRTPEFQLVTLDGDTVRSLDLRGEVVVLNFWATWCLPCRLEMPSLQSLHEDRGADGVRVLGLATDVGSEGAIRDFLEERSITYPVGRASDAQRRAFGGIAGIPTTFVIDRDGVVQHRVIGYFAPPALRAAVSRLLEP